MRLKVTNKSTSVGRGGCGSGSVFDMPPSEIQICIS